MPKLKIEKGIPVPKNHGGGLNAEYEILDRLEVGDSVLFTTPDIKRARNNAYRRQPKKFTFRKMPNGNRCWRVE